MADRQGSAHAAHEGGMRRRTLRCVWWINGPACSALRINRRCASTGQRRPVPGRRDVLRRQRLGVRADRHAGLDAVRPSLARGAGRCGAGRNLERTCPGSSAAPTSTPGCRRTEAVTARALRDAEIKPAGLWARRARVVVARRAAADARTVPARHGPRLRPRRRADCRAPGMNWSQRDLPSAGAGIAYRMRFHPWTTHELPRILGTIHGLYRADAPGPSHRHLAAAVADVVGAVDRQPRQAEAA